MADTADTTATLAAITEQLGAIQQQLSELRKGQRQQSTQQKRTASAVDGIADDTVWQGLSIDLIQIATMGTIVIVIEVAIAVGDAAPGWLKGAISKAFQRGNDTEQVSGAVSGDYTNAGQFSDAEMFDIAYKFSAKWEGDGCSNHPADIGGYTCYGVAQNYSSSDVGSLGKEGAKAEIKRRFWDAPNCGQYAPAMAIVCLDTNLNFGAGGYQWLLKQAGADPMAIVKRRKSYRYERVAEAPSQRVFLQGWLNRDNDLEQYLQPYLNMSKASAATGKASDIAQRIIATMERKGYYVAKGEGEINIIHVEGMDEQGNIYQDSADIYDDLRVVIQYRNGQPAIAFMGMATTEASGYWTGTGQMNPRGAARLQFGQWQAWRVGQHCGSSGSRCHEALVQVAPVTVMRDANADKSRSGDAADTGLFGINLHGGMGGDKGTVGAYSAGCLVSSNMNEHQEFMSVVKSSAQGAGATFYGTLLDGQDLLEE